MKTLLEKLPRAIEVLWPAVILLMALILVLAKQQSANQSKVHTEKTVEYHTTSKPVTI